ncbi:hypothetical protein [Legionella jamestowniensis]|nr:hypothetical protein [Legionella jamestowniensis]OCH98423.1 hypothetical protein A8135_12805 [Legionella jamestowniensis]
MENARLTEHKRYFSHLLKEHRYLFLALLIPTFLVGWQEGKRVRSGRGGSLKRFAKFMFSTSFATLNTKNLFK